MYSHKFRGPLIILFFLLGSDDEWNVGVPPCVGEPMLWCDEEQDETVESSTGMH